MSVGFRVSADAGGRVGRSEVWVKEEEESEGSERLLL